MSQRVWMKWLAVAGMVLATCAANATEATVAGDAYVNSAYPSTNFGGLTNLYVGSGGTALIQFDLSSLPAGTTASQIGKATLKLYVNRVNSSGTVTVLPITSTWSESSVTYSTIPTLGSAIAAFTPTVAQQFAVIDVTSLVQAWVTTPSSNFGVALTSTAGDFVFDSKENDETSHLAHLDVTVVSQGPAGAAAQPELPASKVRRVPRAPLGHKDRRVRLAQQARKARRFLSRMPGAAAQATPSAMPSQRTEPAISPWHLTPILIPPRTLPARVVTGRCWRPRAGPADRGRKVCRVLRGRTARMARMELQDHKAQSAQQVR